MKESGLRRKPANRRRAAAEGQTPGGDPLVASMLDLQQAAGNQAVNAMLGGPVQRQEEEEEELQPQEEEGLQMESEAEGELVQAQGGGGKGDKGGGPSEAALKKRFNLFQLINGLVGPSESVGEAGEDPKAAERTERQLMDWAKKKYQIYIWNSGGESLWKVPK